MERQRSPELMDQPAPDPTRVREALGDLVRMNRYLGVAAAITRQLASFVGHPCPSGVRVLDVGSGRCDVLQALDRWCWRREIGFSGLGLDIGREVVREASHRLTANGRRSSIAVVRGDGRRLPFDDRSFDITICNTFLHHFDPGDVVQVLSEMVRVSKLGIVVSDLRRDVLGYIGAWVLARTVWRRHPYTRHDALVSMRSAYTLSEIRELAMRANLSPEVEPQLFFRWILRWRRPE